MHWSSLKNKVDFEYLVTLAKEKWRTMHRQNQRKINTNKKESKGNTEKCNCCPRYSPRGNGADVNEEREG
eukprot:11694263-Ditylum_brightwellii.AAC.1